MTADVCPNGPLEVVHVISGLSTGGAEMALYKLLQGSNRRGFSHRVVSMLTPGPLAEKMRALGVSVESLDMRRGIPNPRGLISLVKLLRRTRPNIVQCWMYHADLLGGLAARMAGRMPLLWGIRNSTLDAKTSKRTTIQVVRLCARLSRLLPSRIICCSKEAMRIHIDLGYAAQKFVVIPNGFDLDLFKPDPAARREVRGELGVRDDAILIGLGARFDPQKDHLNFVEAASVLAARHANVEFVLWGDEITWDNHILADAIAKSGFGARFHLLGWRGDTSRLSAALDIGALSSAYGEAFPNVLGEIMACGVPCVATNVGDSALIIADTGRVVPIRDSQALTSGWEELISIGPDKRADLGAAARRRVQAHFKLSDVVSRYETVYLDLARRDLNIANAPNR